MKIVTLQQYRGRNLKDYFRDLPWEVLIGAVMGAADTSLLPSRPVPGKRLAQVSEVDCGVVDHFHSSVQLWRNRQGFFPGSP